MEWKFSRAQMWLEWIDKGNAIPVPFNIIYYSVYVLSSMLFVLPCWIIRCLKGKGPCCTSKVRQKAKVHVIQQITRYGPSPTPQKLFLLSSDPNKHLSFLLCVNRRVHIISTNKCRFTSKQWRSYFIF